MRLPSKFLLLAGCFFLSGFAGLVYETVWAQQFAVVFGTTELAMATVLAAYMAGLAGGAAVAGRLAHRVRFPIRLYALLELGIGLSALAVPHAIHLTGRLHRVLLGGDSLSDVAGTPAVLVAYVVTSFLILLLPTAMMGATLPLLARQAVRRENQIGTRVGALYTINTAGAALGTLAAAFYFLPRFGLVGSVWIAAGINALVCLLAWALSRDLTRGRRTLSHESWRIRDVPEPGELPKLPLILPLILVSGGVSFTLEILWTRFLTLLLGGSVYAFATMLFSFLSGIALGAAFGSRFATDRRRARLGFALAQIAAAGLTVGAFLIADSLPPLARSFLSTVGGSGRLAGMAGLCALTLLPAAMAFGATFPFAVRILARDAADAPSATGRVFAWNTAGAILGSLSAGFVVLPSLGFGATAATAAGICLLLAALAWPFEGPHRWTRAALVALLICATFTGLRLGLPYAPEAALRHRVLANTAPDTAPDTASPDPKPFRGTIRHLGVGRSATILLFEQRQQWRLVSNGLPESAILRPWARPGQAVVARWLSLLPVATRPDNEDLLVIGLGAGVTVEDVPAAIREIHVVELEPEIVRANQEVAHLRRKDPLADPRLSLHLGDARGTLERVHRSFGAIVSQPSHPWTAGASHLFTREFFTLVRERLDASGLFVQWMGLPFVDEELLRSLVATLCDVFPYVEIYHPPGKSLLFLASSQPLDLEANVGRALRIDPKPWSIVGVTSPEDVIVTRVLDADGTQRFAVGATVSTDGRNLLRIHSPRLGAGESLAGRGTDSLFAPWDPLARRLEAADADRAKVIRSLVKTGQLTRARRLAATLDDAVERDTALGLVEGAAGRTKESRAAWLRALSLDRTSVEARAGILQLHRQFIATGLQPAELALLGDRSETESLILLGWQLAGGARWKELSDLDGNLAGTPARHPLFRESVRLRALWMTHLQDATDPATAIRALELLEPLLAPQAESRDLVLRAEAASRAGELMIALSSLTEVMPRLHRAQSKSLQRRVIRLLHSIEPETRRYSVNAPSLPVPSLSTAISDTVDPETWRVELLTQGMSMPPGAIPAR